MGTSTREPLEHSDEVASLLFCAGEQSAARVAARLPETARSTPHVILPMAGFGRRFKEEGYIKDKPLIEVGGRTLLHWSLSCLSPRYVSLGWEVIPVLRVSQPVEWIIDEISIRVHVTPGRARAVVLSGPTQGAACSVLAAAVGLPPDDPVLVMNADQWFKFEGLRTEGTGTIADNLRQDVKDLQGLTNWAMLQQWDGFILTFPGKGPAWSYAVTNGTNRVVHVIEKKEVSPYATVGVYWWRRAGDLVRSICAMIAVGQKTNQEFYMAPAYNFLPLSDKNVQIVQVEEFMGLGTPEQVRAFEARLAGGWTP